MKGNTTDKWKKTSDFWVYMYDRYPKIYMHTVHEVKIQDNYGWCGDYSRYFSARLIWVVLKNIYSTEDVHDIIYDDTKGYYNLHIIQRLIEENKEKFETLEQFYSL